MSYFLSAYNDGIKALLYAHQGYYSLTPNVATYVSTLFPLQYAPWPTYLCSFIVTIFPGLLIISSDAPYLNKFWHKLVAILIVYFTSNTEEVWLNTINAQFWFMVSTFLLLLESKADIRKLKEYTFLSLAFFSGLSGVPANILAPFFLLRYYLKNETLDLKLFIVFVITSLAQVVIILNTEHFIRFSADLVKIKSALLTSIYGFTHYPINELVSINMASIYSIIIIAFLVKNNQRIVFYF